MAGPMLERFTMTAIPNHDDGLGEALITTREAVWRFNLPEYWLSHPKERRRRGIPHYRVGKLLRFKASELERWLIAAGTAHA